MRYLALASVLALGCSPSIIGATVGDQPHSGQGPQAPQSGQNGQNGQNGNMCPQGTHLDGTECVSNEVTCASEFPCPNGQSCIGGRCVEKPGPCASNNDCPSGEACVSGQCAPVCDNGNPQCTKDADCGPNNLCIACLCVSVNMCTHPTADVSGAPWQAHQVLHLDEALGAFGKGIVGILKKLRDGIMGCPPGSSNDCFLFEIIASFLPDWAQTLVVALGNFGDVLDNHDFLVDSTMTFTKNGKPSGYDGVDHWDMLTFSYQNHVVMKAPKDVPQIGKDVAPAFTSSAVCGILYVDKHKVEGVLSGILKWIVDTVVQISSNGQYQTLGDAIDGAIDCWSINDLAAQAACFAFTNGLKTQIDNFIDNWLLNYSLMTLTGTAVVVPTGHALDDGHWDGTLGDGIGIFDNFTGEWTAQR